MDQKQTQNQTQAGKGTGASAVTIDKNRSAEQYIKEVEAYYIIPTLVREKFPDLIKLIYETESMNEEEREYWLQILPIMSEEQIVKFRGILVNEKEQLMRLDSEYQKEMGKINSKANTQLSEEEIKKKLSLIKQSEKSAEDQEKAAESDLLKKLQGM